MWYPAYFCYPPGRPDFSGTASRTIVQLGWQLFQCPAEQVVPRNMVIFRSSARRPVIQLDYAVIIATHQQQRRGCDFGQICFRQIRTSASRNNGLDFIA